MIIKFYFISFFVAQLQNSTMNKKHVKVIDSCNLDEIKCAFNDRVPVVLKKLNIGNCQRKWDVNYLSQVLGETPVKVHVSPVGKMDFIKKNFQYKTLCFDEFLKRASGCSSDYFICKGEKYYLRSLGDDPRKDISDIHKQFPGLATDLSFPEVFDRDHFFSSVFRISSAGVQLWTHYDIMDNILIHISGRKRVVLFPPKDALNLYMVGDKSEILDIEETDYSLYPKFRNVARFECVLDPGDILFIPALWFHNVTAIDFSISVNVFWKHLPGEFYDSKDVYGNKDLIPAQKAMQGLEKALKNLSSLPDEYRDFFSRRLIAKIQCSMDLT